MRLSVLGLVIVALGVAPAAAQPTVERRVERLEQDVRSLQRRLQTGRPGATVEPEIGPQAATPQTASPAAGVGAPNDALATLAARVDAVEAQLARITGRVEEQGNRLRQLEEALTQLRAADRPRPESQPSTGRPPAAEPATETPADFTSPAEPQTGTASDPAEAAYNAGFRLWEQRRYTEAQAALTAAGERFPSSRWASWARNLAGRAYLDDNKPATAARLFLANYQADARGERAADSLFFLGEALVRLNRQTEACPVYDELAQVYPTMRDYLRERLPAARRAARCR